MPAEHLSERLARVRSRVDSVFRILVKPSPDVLAQCETLLEAAVEDFESSRPFWIVERGNVQVLEEARRTRIAVGQAGCLLWKAAAYHRGWYQFLATQNAGYTSSGDPAQLCGPSRIILQG